jgi:hypothetical protein
MLDGGIDKLVDQKADAYRGNPQALQQSYAKNQELMDLLAMQKLKAEKDAAARDMAMKAEQMPGTIAEQMEQEMLGRTKDDLVAQTSGILDQKQKKAAQTAQALGQPAPGAKPPQGAGIASMAPPQGMPQFEEGGEVDDAKGPSTMEKAKARITVADIKEKIQNGSLKRAQFDGLVAALPSGTNKDEIVSYLQESHSYEPTTEALTGPMDSDMPPMDLAGSKGFESIAAPEEEEAPAGRPSLPQRIQPPAPQEGLASIPDAFATSNKRFTAEEMEQTGAGDNKTRLPEGMSQGEFDASVSLEKIKNISYKRRQELRKKYPNATLAELATLAAQDKAAENAGIMAEKKRQVASQADANANEEFVAGMMADRGLTPETLDAEVAKTPITNEDTGVMDGMTTGGEEVVEEAAPVEKSAEQLLMEELGGMGTDATELQSTQDDINAVSPTRFSDSMPRAMDADGNPIEGLAAIDQGAAKLAATDPVAMRAAEEKRLEDKANRGITGQVGPDGKPLTKVQEMLKQGTDYQAMIDRQTSGDALKQRKRDALMGGLSKGGFRGGAQAGRNMRRNVMNEERATFMMKRGLDLAAINKDFDIIKAAGEGGQSAYESAVADRRSGLNLVADIGAKNLEAMDAKITQIYANADNAIKNRLASIKTQLDASLKSQEIRQANSKQLDEIAKQLDTVRGKIAEEVGKIAAVSSMTDIEIQAMITDRELEAGIDVRQKELDLRLKQLYPNLRALAVEEVASDNQRETSEKRQQLAAEVAARTK